MNKYKPEYMGKVIPADDPAKLTDFVANKYESFSKAYDSCKNNSDKIKDVKPVDIKDGSTEFSMKVSTDATTMKDIIGKNTGNKDVSVKGDVITAK